MTNCIVLASSVKDLAEAMLVLGELPSFYVRARAHEATGGLSVASSRARLLQIATCQILDYPSDKGA